LKKLLLVILFLSFGTLVFASPQGNLVIGDTSDNVSFGENANVLLTGKARVTRHLRVGAGSWNHGAAAPAAGFEGVWTTLDFDNATDDEAHFTLIVPHRWDTTVNIEFVVTWFYDGAGSPGTVEDAGTVCWALEYKAVKAGESVTGAGTTIAKTSAGNHSSDKEVRTTFTATISASNLEACDSLGFRLYRDVDGGGDSGDTLAVVARMTNTHFHFCQNKLGKPCTY